MPKTKKIVFLIVKIAVMAALLVWVFGGAHWNDYEDASGQHHTGLVTALSQVNKSLLAVACGCYLAMLLILGLRWWFLLRIQDIHIPLWEAMRLTFLGYLFSNAVPGTVGGDLLKAWYVSKHTPRKAAVVMSIFVDRMLGMTELTLLAAVMVGVVLIWQLADPSTIFSPMIAVAVLLGVLVFGFLFVFSQGFRKLLGLQRIYQRWPIAHHFEAAGEAAGIYRSQIGGLIKAIGVTFGAHIIWITGIAIIGMSLNIQTPFYTYLLNTPLIYILAAGIPTPGGVGGVEAGYKFFFSNVDQNQIILLALLARLMTLLTGLPGAVVAITGPKLPRASVLQAELDLGKGTAPTEEPEKSTGNISQVN